MIIRNTGSGWLLNRQAEESHPATSIDEVVRRVASLPIEEPVGLLWPCVADILSAPWTQITTDLLDQIENRTALVPIHLRSMPQAARRLMDAHPLWLGSDSLLFKSMPEAARRYALPRELSGDQPLRFGVDGLAHAWAVAHCPGAEQGKTISVHLGNQTTLAALRAGAAVETSTGFSGLEGVGGQMSCGQIDPSVVIKLAEQIKDPNELDLFLRSNSGWNGFMGRSVTLVELLSIQDIDLARCQQIFETQLVREIGALAAVLGGPDRIIFFGQNHPAITDWLPFFLKKYPLLAGIPHTWLTYADWMLEESIYSIPQNASNPSA